MSTEKQNLLQNIEELSDEESEKEEEKSIDNVSHEGEFSGISSKVLQKKEFLELLDEIKGEASEIQDQADKLRNLSAGDPLYQLLGKSNKYLISIETEIPVIHKKIKEIYSFHFPDLESIVVHSVDFAKVVLRIGLEHDMTRINFKDILPNNLIISLSLSGSNTNGRDLTSEEYEKVIQGCNQILELDRCRTAILTFMEQRMQIISPNVCAIVGVSIAAKLVAAAGGIKELAFTPACNIQVLGSRRHSGQGLSVSNIYLHTGFIGECEFVKVAPEPFRKNVIRMLSTKTALAARADIAGTCPSGQIGRDLKEKIVERYKKLQDPQLPKFVKPLPKPVDKTTKHRAGKRLTAFRKRVKMTEYRKNESRVPFGKEAQQEYRETGKTFGMLGVQGTGRLKIRKESNQKILKKLEVKKQAPSQSSGLMSSLVFSEPQGIQLYNPDFLTKEIQKEKESYFSAKSGFSTVTTVLVVTFFSWASFEINSNKRRKSNNNNR